MNILSKNKKSYTGNYEDHLFEQYKIYIEGMEKTSDRRHQTNNYFIAINTIVFTVIGLTYQIQSLANVFWLRILLSFLGIIISIIFYFLIRSYKQLNTGKFEVIHEIERQLPLALYKYEWEVLGHGKNKNKYYPFSHIELLIPWIFGIIYLILCLYFFISSNNFVCKIIPLG